MLDASADSPAPAISAIIPALNAAATIGRCLDAIASQATNDLEVIVVDDGSVDATAKIASYYNVRLLKLPRNAGPSAARNRGAEIARGPILFFLDADVALAPGAIVHAREAMARDSVDAMIGSYDDEPAIESSVSRFKNLAHHYFHQRSGADTNTFWGACGLISREAFFAAGGFDEHRDGIEDVELGYRLRARGVRIVLDPKLQVKHLKRWTLRSLVATDVRKRAIPWTLLWLQGNKLPSDLNFAPDQRTAAALAIALLVLTSAALLDSLIWIAVAALLVVAIWVNRSLYRLLFDKGGLWFAAQGFLLQQFYYLYSAFAVCAGLAIHFTRGKSSQ